MGDKGPSGPSKLPVEATPYTAAGSMANEPKMSWLDRADKKVYETISGIGSGLWEMLKGDVRYLKNDPIGYLKTTLDEWTIGQQARDLARKGDYAGAIVNSGIGQFAALPEITRMTQGKFSPVDAAWVLATYFGGPTAKSVKTAKEAAKTTALRQFIKTIK